MRFTALLLALLAATAAHSHSEIVLPELPIPEIDQLFPVDDMAAAFRWADWPMPAEISEYTASFSWGVLVLSESQFAEVSARVSAIQQPLYTNKRCDWFTSQERFALFVYSEQGGGVDSEELRVWWAPSNEGFKNRYFPVGWRLAEDVTLRDSGMSIRLQFRAYDYAACDGEHTSHSNGSPRHNRQTHETLSEGGPFTDWLPVADLLDGNVAVTPPAEPAEPAEPEAEPPAVDNSAELAQLQATVAALRDSLRAAGAGAAALRGSLLALQAQIDALEAAAGGTTTTITLVDTVEIVRNDTLHFCPPTDEERQDLFDAFTGLQDSTAAPKAAAVRPSSWGAIKALMQEE